MLSVPPNFTSLQAFLFSYLFAYLLPTHKGLGFWSPSSPTASKVPNSPLLFAILCIHLIVTSKLNLLQGTTLYYKAAAVTGREHDIVMKEQGSRRHSASTSTLVQDDNFPLFMMRRLVSEPAPGWGRSWRWEPYLQLWPVTVRDALH